MTNSWIFKCQDDNGKWTATCTTDDSLTVEGSDSKNGIEHNISKVVESAAGPGPLKLVHPYITGTKTLCVFSRPIGGPAGSAAPAAGGAAAAPAAAAAAAPEPEEESEEEDMGFGLFD
ncbi:hypothetical protein SARC_00831 [Sphaeroforma arctica JP610]|uniref:60S acidic ribosomal protein P3 n=1 Tax=Sphaeroforma arctica JP610 TaxID=667725 RepID=A0A0L0GDQ9_9EUKA|nr:hypothetical protein SARC_00831 [Sphaeroforma arctica JP610]KNC87021.1 hypothetical protein SARC_00831 [Sphaeroforma arctica JP610]|eukprot:XP_014160923.1 hypothetical protein SARC_00831 [Sphaeroforma arctica JP610]